jgi:DNA-binding CsgD family transcriptional regulator/tetratricopeptide (TPR) repeat protein
MDAQGRWPLVGRSDEVALALDALRRHRPVVLAGASGVGKTRLAREVMAAARAGGAPAHWVTATRSAGTVALAAFAPLVPAEPPGVGEGQDQRAATLDAMVRTLKRQATEGRAIVGVDDAHLLDDASATLVHLLATGGAARLVITVRSGEPTPDPVVALWKDELALRIELQPLSRPEVAELLGGTLGGTVDSATARRLFDVTRGNVLFLRELVDEGRSSGALVERSGVWCWDGALQPGVRLGDLIAERLGALADDERDALELVALGEPVAETVLARLVNARVLRRLERRHLVAAQTVDGRVELHLDHPLFGEVLLGDASLRRLNECRRQLAAAWEQESSLTDDEVLRVAGWRQAAGDHSNPGILLAGARRAALLGDDATVERLARGAHRGAPSIEAALLLGDALSSLGRSHEAIEAWQAAEDLPGSEADHARLATGIAEVLAAGLGRLEDAQRVLRDAAARLRDPVALDEVTSRGALLASLGARTSSAAIAIAEREFARPGLSERGRLRAQLAAAAGWIDAGAIDRAIQTAEEAIGAAIREEIPSLSTYHAMTLAQALVVAGRLREAEALVEAAYEGALSAHADLARGAFGFLRGVLAVFRGQAPRAEAALRESDLLLGRADYGFRRGVLIWLAMARALAGDGAAADRLLDEAQRANRSRARLYDADWARARAWAMSAAGRLTDAAAAAAEAAAVAVGGERWTYEVLALHDEARFGGAAAVAPRLEELAGMVDGRLAQVCAAHARAMAAADGHGLDAAASEFGELGFDLFAVDARAAAARAHGDAGHEAHARASAVVAHRLAAGCEGATTPLLRSLAALDRPAELTRRERETAGLAARGHTDREIADLLFVSVRTVHAHLRSAYAKLGVSRRGELASVLGIPPEGQRQK